MTQPDYTYASSGRRPAVFAFLVAALIFEWLAYYAQAELWLHVPVALSIVFTVWMLIVNTPYGIELTGPRLDFHNGHQKTCVIVTDIKSLVVINWSDGAPSLDLNLKNGQKLVIPGICVGNWKELANALAERGVTVNVR